MSYNVTAPVECARPYLGPSMAEVCPGSQFVMFMAVLDTFIRAKQEISQLCERVRPVNSGELYYDFIVIGGGTAGSVVASRLSDLPEWKVLLLEAGPDEPPGAEVPSMVSMFLGGELDWQYRTVDEAHACLTTGGSCQWPRGKNLGGTSVHNGMMYTRGHPKDYDRWAKMGNIGWSYSEVLPYFMCSENNTEINRVGWKYHSVGGLLNIERFPWKPSMADDILAAGAERGYPITEDHNGEQFTGFTIAQTTSKNGVRQSSAAAFLRPYRYRRNLQVVLNATVTKILVEKSKAIGVQYIKDGQMRIAMAGREVIVSGGAINSPQLLMLSGIGPKEHLTAMNVGVVRDLPGVGQNLQNHVSYTIFFDTNLPNEYDLNWASALEYVAFQNGPMASTGLSQVTAILPSRYTTSDDPDLQFFFGGYTAGCAVDGQVGAIMNKQPRQISISPTNLQPRSRGTIHLASNDPLAKPIIRANYLSDPMDEAILVNGIRIALSVVNSTVLAKYNLTLSSMPLKACSQHPFATDAYWSCAVHQDTFPENHQVGTCKMGPVTDHMAVVDPRLRVHGIKGLRVADTSIMPTVISGNTAAPAMMIGERAAAFIKEDWGAAPTQWYGKPQGIWKNSATVQ